uniref:Glutathione S-transferase n=1 Tax=Aegilops tauschii subsp. strangulata TaxID=200361 RepID=A0A452YP18_AEGTS
MAAEGDLKLLGLSVSPFVVRVRMALHMKGLSYEYIEQDLFNKSELLLKSNPVEKKVPVLIHDGKTILDSSAIVQYIDEVWAAMGPSILPVDPNERATARFWAAYVDDKVCAFSIP